MVNVGEMLRSQREELELDVAEVSDTLKIRAKYILAIEDNFSNLEELPASVYLIGYLKTYANYLGLNGEKIVKEVREGHADYLEHNIPSIEIVKSKPNVWVVVVSLLLLWVIYEIISFNKTEISHFDIINNMHSKLESSKTMEFIADHYDATKFSEPENMTKIDKLTLID